MRFIKGIRLLNFGRYRGERVLELAPRAYSLVGCNDGDQDDSNGTGKSTLRRAVRYALYGEVPDSCEVIDDAISSGPEFVADEMMVDLELDDGTFISRRRARSKFTDLVVIAVQNGVELQWSQESAQQEIDERIVGLSFEEFRLVADLEQKTASRLIEMKSAELTKIVGGWVGLDRLEEAESLAAVGLKQLTKEYDLACRHVSEYSWATSEEGAKRFQVIQVAEREVEQQKKQIAVEKEGFDRWWSAFNHTQRFRYAQEVQSKLGKLEAQIAQLPSEHEKLAQLRTKQAEALAERSELVLKSKPLEQVAAGLFDGKCPVLPGFECPARAEIKSRREEARVQLAPIERQISDLREKKGFREKVIADQEALVRSCERAQDIQDQLKLEYDELIPSVKFVEEHGETDESAKPDAVSALDLSAVKGAKQAFESWNESNKLLNQWSNAQKNYERRLKAFRLAVLALEQSKIRIVQGAAQRIERSANQRLVRAGVDVTIRFIYGRETKQLATRCYECGSEFAASAKIKQCTCGAIRGKKIEPQFRIKPSKRSGALDDLAGVAVMLAARDYVLRRRGSEWGVVLLDEPFASLDRKNRRALSAAVGDLVSDGVAQSFVIAHDRHVLESLPGRIEVVSSGAWSDVRVVA